MAKLIRMGLIGSHDPMFGIDQKNVVERLTVDNWQRKAVMREIHAGGCERPEGPSEWQYGWIARGTTTDDAGETDRYYVEAVTAHGPARDFEKSFDTLDEALEYGNRSNVAKPGQDDREGVHHRP